MPEGFDVIGDIHGYAEELKALLKLLGYEKRNGAYQNPNRMALFIGDFIDRGPANLEVVSIVRAMVDAGTARAIMGNHEYNAIGYHTPHPDRDGEFLRKHSEKNAEQHQAFLDEQAASPGEAAEALKWFAALPIFIEVEGGQFAHAAWHQPTIDEVRPNLNADLSMPNSFLASSFNENNMEYRAVETILKGPEYRLPESLGTCRDKDSIDRRDVRLAWWKSPSSGSPTIGLHEGAWGVPKSANFPDHPIPIDEFHGYDFGDQSNATFFGHYWMNNTIEKDRSELMKFHFQKHFSQ